MPETILWCLFYMIFSQMKSPFTNLLQRYWKRLDKQKPLSIDNFSKKLQNN